MIRRILCIDDIPEEKIGDTTLKKCLTSMFKGKYEVLFEKKPEKAYKLITFDMVLPFNLTGFLAKITTELAKEKIPIFAISAYSTDHILIKKRYLNKAVNRLKNLGFELK